MYAIIVNPSSGRGKGVQLFRQVEQELCIANIAYRTLLSDTKETSVLFVEKLMKTENLKGIVVIGGDGTAGSIVGVASRWNLPVAILPAGSGNDTARAFNLTHDPTKFVKQLIEAHTRKIDLLNVDGQKGITIAAAGVDAEIGEKANHSFYKSLLNKFGLGGLAYPIAAIHTLLVFTPFEMTLTIDGESLMAWPCTWLIAAGNTSSYGGGLQVCPQALPNDQIMNITIAHSASRLSLLFRLFPRLLQGNAIVSPSISYLTAKAMTIRADRSVLLILDGEPIHSSTFTIQLNPEALTLIQTIE
ncbi:diacylglycerol/lipid kinase family protein [Sporosarcina aquimarina]|nr:diacylglycerol kinase family lipid kinase [Sporosarcina aquimarina]